MNAREARLIALRRARTELENHAAEVDDIGLLGDDSTGDEEKDAKAADKIREELRKIADTLTDRGDRIEASLQRKRS